MPVDLVFVLKWVKNVTVCPIYIFHLSGSLQSQRIEVLYPSAETQPSVAGRSTFEA